MAKRPAPSGFSLDSSDCKRPSRVPSESSSGATPPNNVSAASELSLEEIFSRARSVSTAAAAGNPRAILAALSGLAPALICKILKVSRYYCASTPLILAVLHDHRCVVQLLVEKFNVNIEESSRFYHEGAHHNTALSVAALKGNLNLVAYLVNHGAHVNRVSQGSRNPLHAACYSGHLDVVRYLLKSGARPEVEDGTRHTCLMAACMRDNSRVVELLLKQGVDPNQKSRAQQTAMHVAGVYNAVRSVRLLLNYGATMTENEQGRTPWVEAVLQRSANFVNVVLDSSTISRQEKIDVLELWGAVCISQRNFDEGFLHLQAAMTERFKDPSHILHKSQRHPVPALNDVSESHTLVDLQSRRQDQTLMMIESVLIFERILGHDSDELQHLCLVVCENLMARQCFRKALSVWTHTWKLPEMGADTRIIYAQLFIILARMWVANSPPAFEIMAGILDLALSDVEHLSAWQDNINSSEFCYLCFSLLAVALKVKEGEDEERQVKDLAVRFVLVHESFGFTRPLLHRAICPLPRYSRVLRHLMDPDVVKLMMQCGADVNAIDSLGNTPLHEVALYRDFRDEADISVKFARSITRVLVEEGAHVDSRNNEGWTPLDVASPVVREVLLEYFPLPLICLAASTIVRHKIPYKDSLPEIVQCFIEQHLPGQQDLLDTQKSVQYPMIDRK